MIQVYHIREGRLAPFESAETGLAQLDRVVWIDLVFPNRQEEAMVEAALHLDIPTREDMQEIELSSRLYDAAGAVFLTASVLSLPNGRDPIIAPVTFILTPHQLVTVRYHSPLSFQTFIDMSQKTPLGCTSGQSVLLALFERIVYRLADILEASSHALEDVSKGIFSTDRRGGSRGGNLGDVLDRIGRAEDLNAKVRDSLTSIDRLSGFLMHLLSAQKGDDDKARAKTLARDIRSLIDYASTQGQKIIFLLDATLGMINIRQSDIIKIFSVVAFVFLPPTLIASIYGMNFEHMPGLAWPYGYPMSLGAMVVSVIIPYVLFRKRGWL